jgi:large subunit ribosomal protein L16
MKQNPSRLKFKKNQKPRKSYLLLNENKVFFPKDGLFAIKSNCSGKLLFNQIEACRKSIKRSVRRIGRIKINVFTYFSKTAKGLGVRMGKGKGSHSKWICPIKAGHVICELSGVSSNLSHKALTHASTKLPFKTQVIKLCY